MRRLKSEVLTELPPKIVQDYFCSLSDLQATLYEDFGKRVQQSMSSREESLTQPITKGSALQILSYLRKLCDHPSLVLTVDHPKYGEIARSGIDINDPAHSGKLVAFAELLAECGIGGAGEHRALVFCQFRGMIDFIASAIDSGRLATLVNRAASDSLAEATSNSFISYLRLDGSVPASERAAIAERFNGDLGVDLLLLTTQVGGLGLNLTGADVVIFVDHDWNPVRDLQAMDRAHRL